MNCKDVESLAYEIARDRMIQATVRDDAFRHIAKCEVCASRLDEELALTECTELCDRRCNRLRRLLRSAGVCWNRCAQKGERHLSSFRVPGIATVNMLLSPRCCCSCWDCRDTCYKDQSLSRAGSTEVSPLTVATSGPSVDSKIPTASVNTVQPTKVAISKPTVSHKRVKTTRPAKTNPKPVNAVDQSREEIAQISFPLGIQVLSTFRMVDRW